MNRAFLWAGCLAAILGVCACASTPRAEPRLAELQAQMVEVQKAQAGVNARMDEMSHALLVLEEAVRLNKDEIDKVARTSTTPRITITNPPARPEPKTPAAALAPLAGQGGEFVAPPPAFDPTRNDLDRAAPPVLPKSGSVAPADSRFRVDPDPALLKDPQFRKAWEAQKPGGYALAIYAWSDVTGGSKDPRAVAAAGYYQAEAYFQLKEYTHAISLFQGLADDAQAGAYRAAAAYRWAGCLDATGRLADAKAQYRKVAEKFPGSEAATLATERLKRLE